MTDVERPKLAFLGPRGTYSHQAAYERYLDTVEYREETTISDVFHSLPDDASMAVIPQENSIFGIVVETYDLFREMTLGLNACIVGEVSLGIQHCLLVPRGVNIEQIETVFSHEQALGQCSHFLSESLPSAKLVETPSTAAAAAVIAEARNSPRVCAAICSKMCATIFNGLEILREGIQNEKRNFTRFFFLSTHRDSSMRPLLRRALMRVTWPSSQTSGNLSALLLALVVPATRVDRRPALTSKPFQDAYFIEIEDDATGGDWKQQVDEAAERARESGATVQVLGWW